MNLNTFARHGVFDAEGGSQTKEEKQVTRIVADRLRDAAAISKARVLPYQLMAACANTESRTCRTSCVRRCRKRWRSRWRTCRSSRARSYVLPDVSGSMQSPVTGCRKGATTAVRCIDVAALVAAAVLRKNPLARGTAVQRRRGAGRR